MNIRRTLLFATLGLFSLSLAAKKKTEPKAEEGFLFTTVKSNPITPIKNQSRAGTCWCYSTFAFLESELLRMGKGEYDFSEMYTVYNTYLDRATTVIRTHGDVSFSEGGSFYDVIYGMEHYGLVPEAEMRPGVMYGDTLSNHTELSVVTGAYVNAIADSNLKSLQLGADGQPLWRAGLIGIYDAYLGKRPQTFTYEGRTYTPQSFYESTGLKASDYVSLTSYTHHPFYEPFVLEIQDNWRWSQSYNLPIDELMQVFDYAIEQGYTIAWGTDVSEVGFTRDGIGVMPDVEKGAELTGSDMARWLGLSQVDRSKELTSRPLPEVEVTQEMRQRAYDAWTTTDDHGMQIFGIAKDQTGKKYYMVKNSWGITGKYDGVWYASEAFVKYKTMNIVVNKNSIPAEIAAKLGLK